MLCLLWEKFLLQRFENGSQGSEFNANLNGCIKYVEIEPLKANTVCFRLLEETVPSRFFSLGHYITVHCIALHYKTRLTIIVTDEALHVVAEATTIARQLYASPAWWGLTTERDRQSL